MIISFLTAYFTTSLNFSILASKLLNKKDPRLSGSKNAGATNLARVAGKHIAAGVLILDIVRAAALTLTLLYIIPNNFKYLSVFFILAGNLFPIFHKFKGGKGVATSLGIILAIAWPVALTGLACFFVVFWATRFVSAASLSMAVSWPITLMFFKTDIFCAFCFWAIAAIILITHKNNVLRLWQSKEQKF